jgi:hypothetical protein
MMMVVMVVMVVMIRGECRHGYCEQQNSSQYGDYGLLHSYVPPANAHWSVHSVFSTLPRFFPWAKVCFFDPYRQPPRLPGGFHSTIPPQTVYTRFNS